MITEIKNRTGCDEEEVYFEFLNTEIRIEKKNPRTDRENIGISVWFGKDCIFEGDELDFIKRLKNNRKRVGRGR